MNVISDVAIIAATSYRSRAYAQRMLQEKIVPSVAVIIPGREPNWDDSTNFKLDIRGDGKEFEFDPSVPAVETFREMRTPILELPNSAINSAATVNFLKTIDANTFIYSGGSGGILKPDTLACGKKFLHIHGGFVPQYRGSTTFYYSILDHGKMGASAIWLNEQIDQGPIISRRRYNFIPGIDIDSILDPAVRADLLVEVLREKIETGKFADSFSDNENAMTYQIIHPVLKHLALQKCGLTQALN